MRDAAEERKMTNTEKALRFWKEVNERFPHQRVTDWMATLEGGRVDWFRNASIANVALEAHSRNRRGFFSQAQYDSNKAALGQIVDRHEEITSLMQP